MYTTTHQQGKQGHERGSCVLASCSLIVVPPSWVHAACSLILSAYLVSACSSLISMSPALAGSYTLTTP